MLTIQDQIGKTLVTEGYLDETQWQTVLELQDEENRTLDRLLVERAFLTEEQMLTAFGLALDMPTATDLSSFTAPQVWVERVSGPMARSRDVIGLEENDGVVRVATCAPLDVAALDEVAGLLGLEVEAVLSPRSEIRDVVDRSYRDEGGGVDDVLEGLEGDELDMDGVAGEAEDLLDVANRAPIIKLVNMIIYQALNMRASDIHIQPYEDKLQVRYRIDGILYDMNTPPKNVHDAIVSRVKVMANMDIAERRLPQDGRTSIRVGDREVDLRISTLPTSMGERIVFRVLDKTTKIFKIDEIGLSPKNLDILRTLVDYSHGILLVTGPTGSGKSTTLYASLTHISSAEKNILTIEDPVEYQLRGISQIEVSEKKGMTFATGLRSIVRQDPDVIMVGEIRDLETAEIAIQSALTGHLVFSTLHTNDASGAVTRLVELGIEPYLVSSSVIGVVAQRLARLICPDCREGYKPEDGELESVNLTPDDLPEGLLYRGRGCDKCFNTGYMGRTGVHEILPITEAVRDMIVNRASSADIKKHAVEREGLTTLRADGGWKAAQGETTVEEVMRLTQMDMF